MDRQKPMLDVQPWEDVLPDVPPARGYRNRCLLKTTMRAIEREGLGYFQRQGSNSPERTPRETPIPAAKWPQGCLAAFLFVACCRTYSTMRDSFGGMAVASRAVVVRWWTGLAIAVVLAFLPIAADGQPARTFEVLDGHTHPDSLRAGTMLTLTEWRISGSDTLRVWAERVTRDTPPSRASAQSADRVVWCYPDQYPDDRHLFPRARVVLSFGARQEGTSLIMFVTEEAYERHYTELGWQALALH